MAALCPVHPVPVSTPPAAWELTVTLATAGERGAVVLGQLVGDAPGHPVDVDVYVGERVLRVVGAEVEAMQGPGGDVHAVLLPGRGRGDVASGAVVRPAGAPPPPAPPSSSAMVFGRRRVAVDARYTIRLRPDYGGVAFDVGGAMASTRAFADRIPADLQAALDLWYREWDETTTTDRWSAEEWSAEGRRLAAELNRVLGPDWDFSFDR